MFPDGSNNVITTMASETTLFKKRIITLIQITNALGDFDLSYLLQALGERVCSTGNLNSGGKFEWIDSVLVKVSDMIVCMCALFNLNIFNLLTHCLFIIVS